MKRLIAAAAILVGMCSAVDAATIGATSSGTFLEENGERSLRCYNTIGCVGGDEAGISKNSEIAFWPYRACDGVCNPNISRSSLKFVHYELDPLELVQGD